MPNKLQLSSPEAEKVFKDKMAKMELQEKEKVSQKKAESLGFRYINLKGFPIGDETLILIPEKKAQEAKAICFFKSGQNIKIGALNPENKKLKELIKDLKKKEDYNIEIYLISEESLKNRLKLYEKIFKIRKIVRGIEISQEDLEKFKKKIKVLKDVNKEIQKGSITDFIALIIASALKFSASDVHLETEENDVKIRFRIDGVLHQAASLPIKIWPQIISRVKLISKLKLNIVNRPQDGRFSIFLTKEELDVRVSTIPTNYGESAVIRLFSGSAANLSFDDLGLSGGAYEQLKEQISKPNGMVIVTGPTGSGKTTTLYAILNKLNKPDIKIITLEDPIEYKLEGIIQSHIESSKDYTFASGLKSILRQDPDIIMVGEIRDLDTAEISIQAALTGHLVISSLHANGAAAAIPRLLSLGAKPFLIAPALNAVIAQRLVRRLCLKCREEIKLDEETLKKVKVLLKPISLSRQDENNNDKSEKEKINLEELKFYQSKGCKECQGIGYKGRIGIFEVFVIDSETEKIILRSEISEYKMKEISEKKGMITMAQDGLLKALDGITSVEEVFRVTG
ncbi:MAG: Uncharacterized protein Athens101410_368 [Parcubacteria group bacterium Athens1014_10]|nr:MAG: Uncharacterized protein Athens101410_368 [Parcubacteria group bacterium Athens1014_10]TSD05118.1 MAG: Uncharacterized protein Athens071412_487 [Parcubacteria group bacterium Athens0714_12]